MGNLSYTPTASRPRTISSVSDWDEMPFQGNYGTIDSTFRTRLASEANNIASKSAAEICRNTVGGVVGTGGHRDDIHKKVLTLCLASKALELTTDSVTLFLWKQKAQDIAVYINDTSIPLHVAGTFSYGVNSRRSATLALAYVLDLIYSFHNATPISKMGTAILYFVQNGSSGARLTLSSTEIFDGHSSGDQACAFIASLALHGESGFTSGGNNAATYLARAANFWWGGETSVTLNGEARLNFNRYFCSDGGHGKSVWYSMLEGWYTSLILQAARNGLESMTLNGDPYTLPASESWVDKLGEWFLNFAIRGDLDYWHVQGDTERSSNPWMHEYTSVTLAYLIRYSSTFRNPLRWVYDKILAKTHALSQNPVYNRVADYILFDPGLATYAPIQPDSAVPVPSKSKLMDPPGIYVYRNSWDIGGQNNCTIVVEAPSFFWRGHSSDLKCGSIQICVRDDIVLMNRGMYSSNQDTVADFGGSYTNNWSRQSISSSGVPLIDDLASTATGSPNYTGTPHTDAGPTGVSQPYPHGTGGQLFRFDHTAPSSPVPNDPYTITKMTGDGGGLTWRRVTGIDGETDRGLELREETTDLVFLTADLHRAYIARTDHYNTSSDRVEVCTMKLMVIKNEGAYPILFRVMKVKARQASYKKRDIWQFYGNPVLGEFDTTGKFNAPGFLQTTSGGVALGGKCLIAYHNFGDYTATQAGDAGSAPPNGWSASSANHHAYTVGNTTTLTRFPLAAEPSNRQKTDVGRFRVEIRPKTQVAENVFVNLIVPLDPTGVEPDFTLLEDPNFYIVRFGDTSSKRVYKIHKTATTFEGPTDPLDVVPPDPPVIAATPGPRSAQVTVSWNPAPESDFRATRVFYREKA